MQKFKKFMAVALAATMVMGSSLIANAAQGVSSDSEDVTSTGRNEGHLDTEVYKVEIPVNVADSFYAYTVDPEHLVQKTLANGATELASEWASKGIEASDFSDNAKADGVYFTVSGNGIDSTSGEQSVTSKSSVPVTVTLKLELIGNGTDGAKGDDDIDVVETTDASVKTPQLELILNVSGNDVAAADTQKHATYEKAASVEVKMEAPENSYIETVSNGNYVYEAKEDAVWPTATFSLSGKVNTVNSKDNTKGSDLKAPKVKVTWSFAGTSEDAVEGYAEYADNAFWMGTTSSAGFETGKTATSVIIDGKDVSDKVTMRTYGGTDWVVVTWADASAAGVKYAGSGNSYELQYVVDGVTYTASFLEE